MDGRGEEGTGARERGAAFWCHPRVASTAAAMAAVAGVSTAEATAPGQRVPRLPSAAVDKKRKGGSERRGGRPNTCYPPVAPSLHRRGDCCCPRRGREEGHEPGGRRRGRTCPPRGCRDAIHRKRTKKKKRILPKTDNPSARRLPPPPSPPCSCYYYNMPRLPATGADQARPPTGGARSARPADAPGGARPPPRRPGAAAGTAGPDRRWPAAAAAAPALRRQWGERHRPGGRCGNLPPLVGQGRHWRGGWLTQWPPRRLPHHPYPSRDSRNYG